MLTPMGARRAYGPVSSLLGTLDYSELPPELRGRIAREVESDSFAFVSLTDGLEANINNLVVSV